MATDRDRVSVSIPTFSLAVCLILLSSSCSGGSAGAGSGGAGGTGGAKTSSGGSTGSGGTSATGGVGSGGAMATGGSATGGTGGGLGTGGGGTGGTGTGGAATGGNGAATGGSGTGGGGAGKGSGGASVTGGNGGAANGGAGAGATNCAGRAISLSANQTGSATDAARARVVADLLTDLPIGNAPRTVEFWAFIKTTDWVGEHNEIFEYGTTGTTTAFGLDFGTNPVTGMPANHATLDPYTNGGFNDDSTNDLGITSTMDQWVHIAMTWDGTALRTYVNGTLRITTNGTGGTTMLATAQSPLTIGCNDPIFNCFNGMFDEFRVWRIARPASEILRTYNKVLNGSEADLIGYWKFDDAPGSSAAVDSVISAGHTPHNGTLTAVMASQKPTFVTPTPAPPILCP